MKTAACIPAADSETVVDIALVTIANFPATFYECIVCRTTCTFANHAMPLSSTDEKRTSCPDRTCAHGDCGLNLFAMSMNIMHIYMQGYRHAANKTM